MDIVLTPDKELPQKVGKLIDQLVHDDDLGEKERDRMENKILYGILSKESTDRVPLFPRITGTASYLDKLRNRQMNVPLGSKGIRIERPEGVWTHDDLSSHIAAEDREHDQRRTTIPHPGKHKKTTPFTARTFDHMLGGGRRRTRRGSHDHISQELERLMAHGRHNRVIPPPPMPDGVGDLIEIWNKFGKALHLGAKSIRKALTRKHDMMSNTLGKTAGRGGRRKRTRRRS
jgi:hypothetical protein